MVDPEILDIVVQYLQKLRDNGVTVSKGVIFGSRAQGGAGPENDIDVAVISPDFGKDRTEDRQKVWLPTIGLDTRIEPIPIELELYEREDSTYLVHVIRKEGFEISI